jgi:hypothetical protein
MDIRRKTMKILREIQPHFYFFLAGLALAVCGVMI